MPSSQVVSCDFTLNDIGIVGLLQRSVGERIAATVLASSLTHLHLLQCGAQGRCLNAIVHNCRSLKTLEIDPINNAQMEDFSPDFSPYSVYDPAALAALGDMNDLNHVALWLPAQRGSKKWLQAEWQSDTPDGFFNRREYDIALAGLLGSPVLARIVDGAWLAHWNRFQTFQPLLAKAQAQKASAGRYIREDRAGDQRREVSHLFSSAVSVSHSLPSRVHILDFWCFARVAVQGKESENKENTLLWMLALHSGLDDMPWDAQTRSYQNETSPLGCTATAVFNLREAPELMAWLVSVSLRERLNRRSATEAVDIARHETHVAMAEVLLYRLTDMCTSQAGLLHQQQMLGTLCTRDTIQDLCDELLRSDPDPYDVDTHTTFHTRIMQRLFILCLDNMNESERSMFCAQRCGSLVGDLTPPDRATWRCYNIFRILFYRCATPDREVVASSKSFVATLLGLAIRGTTERGIRTSWKEDCNSKVLDLLCSKGCAEGQRHLYIGSLTQMYAGVQEQLACPLCIRMLTTIAVVGGAIEDLFPHWMHFHKRPSDVDAYPSAESRSTAVHWLLRAHDAHHVQSAHYCQAELDSPGLLLASVLALVPREHTTAVPKAHVDTLLLLATAWAEDHLTISAFQDQLDRGGSRDQWGNNFGHSKAGPGIPSSMLLAVAAGLVRTLIPESALRNHEYDVCGSDRVPYVDFQRVPRALFQCASVMTYNGWKPFSFDTVAQHDTDANESNNRRYEQFRQYGDKMLPLRLDALHKLAKDAPNLGRRKGLCNYKFDDVYGRRLAQSSCKD